MSTKSKNTKYIFVLGGVMSGLGKGIAASSIGYILKNSGLKVTILKLDPYLNVDPGTMNPYQHGEVFVLDDGSETDLDFDPPLYFSIQSFEIPITLRWRNAKFNNFAFWRIYGGVSLNWNFKTKAKQNSNIILFSDDFKKWGVTAHLSFGYNTWNFYLAYRLNPIFNSIPRNNQDFSIQLTPIKFGLIFFIL